MTEKDLTLYNTPVYYDVAFSWDPKDELDLYEKVFKNHVPFRVKRVLEPCCGSGRFLVSFPKRGYHIWGYDNSPEMVQYSMKRIRDEGLEDMAYAEVADMRTAKYKDKFDSAINSINSLGYLFDDKDIIAHLKNTAASLKKNAVYVVQISTAFEDLDETVPEKWTERKWGIKIQTIWSIIDECHETKRCHMYCLMKINDNGRKFIHKEEQTMRLWTYDDIKDVIKKSKVFSLEAIYDENHEKVRRNSKINGEKGNLFYVLKRI